MKILLADDARAVTALMMARLSSFGHEVTIACNGQEAFDKFCESPPDLVLMDIEMPLMNGFDATHRIRAYEAMQKWSWTPIIFLTSTDTTENLVMAIEAGADDFLAKGLSENLLHAKMKAMTRIATMRQQLSIANLKLEQADHDDLTGLFNRRGMDINVDQEWAECVRKNSPFALLLLDIDNFMNYNDGYGYEAGDECLCAVAHAIKAVIAGCNTEGITKDAFAARYGGEKFAVVVPGASFAAYESCATRILESVRRLDIQHGQNGEWGIVTVSIGGCRREVSSDVLAMMFRDADEALFRAKNGGHNRIELAD